MAGIKLGDLYLSEEESKDILKKKKRIFNSNRKVLITLL